MSVENNITLDDIRDVVSRDFGTLLTSKYNMNSHAGPQPVWVGATHEKKREIGRPVSKEDKVIVLAGLSTQFKNMSDFERMQLRTDTLKEASNWRIVMANDVAAVQTHLRAS